VSQELGGKIKGGVKASPFIHFPNPHWKKKALSLTSGYLYVILNKLHYLLAAKGLK